MVISAYDNKLKKDVAIKKLNEVEDMVIKISLKYFLMVVTFPLLVRYFLSLAQ